MIEFQYMIGNNRMFGYVLMYIFSVFCDSCAQLSFRLTYTRRITVFTRYSINKLLFEFVII